jgi:hypothetical protein
MFGLISRFVQVSYEPLLTTLMLETSLMQFAGLRCISARLACPSLQAEVGEGLLTGASSRMKMEQYLHQYCFLETQYLSSH